MTASLPVLTFICKDVCSSCGRRFEERGHRLDATDARLVARVGRHQCVVKDTHVLLRWRLLHRPDSELDGAFRRRGVLPRVALERRRYTGERDVEGTWADVMSRMEGGWE